MAAMLILGEWLRAWRNLLRKPGYLLVAALTLALGVAASCAVFSLLYQGLLRPLPFAQPQQLVAIGMDYEGSVVAAPAIQRSLRELPEFSASGIASSFVRNVNVVRDDALLVSPLLLADHGFLHTLGVRMALGRNFSQAEDRPEGDRVVVIGHGFWIAQFGGDANVLGRSIVLEGKPARIIGVLPKDFAWVEDFDLLVPMRLAPASQDMDTNQYAIARLRAPAEGLNARIDARIHALIGDLRSSMAPEAYQHLSRQRYLAMPLREFYTGATGATLWLFFAAALCVLAIAAINLTNLVIQRSIVRTHDSAVRAALGASGLRLAMPAFAEALLIGACGSAAGIALAWAGLRLLGGSVPPQWLPGGRIALVAAGGWFALAIGVLVALLAAALGAWRGRVRSLSAELVGGGRSGLSRHAGRLGRVLVIAQVALAALLLVVASLFMRSLYELNSVPLGFDATSVETFKLAPVRRIYTDIDAVNAQTRAVLDRLRALPGVQRVAVTGNLPLGSQLNLPATLADGRSIQPQYRPVGGDYFALFAIASSAGRVFDARDSRGAEPVCVVSATFAREYLKGDPLGQTLRMGRGDGNAMPTMRVVGVVGDVRQFGPAEPAPPIVYVPLAQMPPKLWNTMREFGPLNYAVRTHGQIANLEPALRKAVAEAAPQQPIGDIRSMRSVVDEAMGESRLQLLLVGLFSLLALSLACIGLYAVLSVNVAARRHEYGVRAALGASARRLLALVFRDSAVQVAIGLGAGMIAALLAARVIRRFLFGVGAADPLAMLAVALVLALAAAVATALPALRVARSDPMQALRVD
jgi:predicted permease